MVRSAIVSWAVILLLAGLGASVLQYHAFADAVVDIAIFALILAMLIHVITAAADVLRHSRRSTTP